MAWSNEDRTQFAEDLDRAKRQVTTLYRWLLIVVAIGFVSFIAFAAWQSRDSTGSQGEWFYLGVFVLLVLGWIGQKLYALRPSRRTGLDMPRMRQSVEDVPGGSGKVFRFSIGTPLSADDPVAPPSAQDGARSDPHTFTLSRSFGGRLPLPPMLGEHTPDESALATAEEYRIAGRDWDYICDWVNPAYGSWDSLRQSAYRTYIEALLNARREQPPPAAPSVP